MPSSIGNSSLQLQRTEGRFLRASKYTWCLVRCELPPNDVRSVWQKQAVEGTKMSLDEIRRKADCFRTGLRRQNRIAYILLAVLVGAFGWITVWFTPTNLIMRTGGCLVVLGCLYGGYQVYTGGGRRSAHADAGFADCLNFYRSKL